MPINICVRSGALLHIGPSAVVNFDGDTFLNPKAGAVVYGGIDGTVTSVSHLSRNSRTVAHLRPCDLRSHFWTGLLIVTMFSLAPLAWCRSFLDL